MNLNLSDSSWVRVGGVLAMAVGAVDAWFFSGTFSHNVDMGLILGGLGVLTGHALAAWTPNSTTVTPKA